MTDDGPRYASLRDYLQLLRKQWLLIAIPVVLAVAAALFFSARQTKAYTAQAQVILQDETQQLSLLGTNVVPNSSVESSPQVVAQTIKTRALADAVRRRLKSAAQAGALSGDVALSVDSSTGLLNVTATTSTAKSAAALANAFAAEIAHTRTTTVKQQFAGAVKTLQHRVRQLPANVSADAGERAVLLDEISRLQFLQTTSTPAQVAKLAGVPGSPSSPKPVRNVALALLAGLLLGVIFAFVRESFDRRLRGSAEIASELDLRLIGQVRSATMGKAVQPRFATNKKNAGDVETFRILRNNVELLLAEESKRSILVTSGLPEEGKSTVAASLALAAAAAGRRTLLLEADLRRPSLSKRLGIPGSPGLTEYLLGHAEPEEILRSIPVPAPGSTNGAGPSDNGELPEDSTLVCVFAGDPSGSSAELLASERMRTLLDQVTDVYELVVIDTAPVLPVADTLQLLPLVTAVILCVRSGHTTRDQTRAAKSALKPVPDNMTGVMVTDLKSRDEPPGYGLYPYYYSYAERVEP